jgi:hypothetical protein
MLEGSSKPRERFRHALRFGAASGAFAYVQLSFSIAGADQAFQNLLGI